MIFNEDSYRQLVIRVLGDGIDTEGRNGKTREVFGTTIKLNVRDKVFPLITGRKMFYRGIIGEAITLMKANTGNLNVKDFEDNGCNYWKLWADENGDLTIDYPVRHHFQRLIEDIKKDPQSRRHIVNLWSWYNVENGILSLPCCHYGYQFNIQGDEINMIWTQRSADLMIGVPSDMILATIYLRTIAAATGYKANEITMNFGSTHIYEEHLGGAHEYIQRHHKQPAKLLMVDKPFTEFTQEDFEVKDYEYGEPIKFELKA